MSILTPEQYLASTKQFDRICKTASRTSLAAIPFSVFDLAGSPWAGVLAWTNTANGLVPTDATAGCPIINAFWAWATGYLSQVKGSSSVACRIQLYDMLFKAWAYAFNANTTLATQPSYSSRIPQAWTDWTNTEIWIEAVTAFTGNLSVAVTYTNQSWTAWRTTGTVATGVAPTVWRMIQLPLQAGDNGVQVINSVVATVSTVGTFNVLVLRRLAEWRIPVANGQFVSNFLSTGFPQVFADSALFMQVTADSTATGAPELSFEIANW
jgi:hypothetical protein